MKAPYDKPSGATANRIGRSLQKGTDRVVVNIHFEKYALMPFINNMSICTISRLYTGHTYISNLMLDYQFRYRALMLLAYSSLIHISL